MTVSPWFEFDEVPSEQDLREELTIESIQLYGRDVFYIPRHIANFDQLLGADDSSRFETSYTVEMKNKNVLGFAGDKEFYSQFGNQIRDEIVFTVAKRRWMEEVGSKENMTRPNEGDLIWHPKFKKLFVVKFVDPRESFYALGRLYSWTLTCEVFEYSGETIDTGFQPVDDFSKISVNEHHWALTDESGAILTDEDGNILVVDGFDVEKIDPGSVNTYVPEELKTVANTDVTVIDPFGFIQSQ